MSDEFPPSTTAYCSSCALCLAFTESRRGEKTITLEFARSTGQNTYDWGGKVGFELSVQEISGICAFLVTPWEQPISLIHGHSPNAKRLRVSQQEQSAFFSLSLGRAQYQIRLSPSDRYLFRNHLLSRLIELQPSLPPALHWRSLQQFSADMGGKR